LPTKTTFDTLLGGQIAIEQPARGYRVNVDTLLLAAFAAAGGGARRLVDLGAGVGALTLAFAHSHPIERAVCVEKDRELAELCRKNLSRARLSATVIVGDVARAAAAPAHGADLVVCNPPFFEPGERRPAQASRESARGGRLGPFLDACRIGLGRRGRVGIVYPARSLSRLFSEAEARGLVPKRLRLVHASPKAPARIALVELKPGKPGGLVVEAPLVEWLETGVPSAELAALSAARRRAGDPT
jgi:tRNA1(Val) A37 N6-methylase TrmN6